MGDFKIGEYIIYVNGDRYELGRIKNITDDGAFVAYHGGETGAKTPFDKIHKLVNAYCIKETTLGGEFFKSEAEAVREYLEMMIKRLESLQTIDLVRCGECKHHDEDGWGYGNCQRPSVDYLRTADEDYCSYGERRADETQP